ncbi:MAG: hypothetical protein M1536_07910 [Firmicutes bacterium]|nr:hypothetical protein [Bacillota bacterium]
MALLSAAILLISIGGFAWAEGSMQSPAASPSPGSTPNMPPTGPPPGMGPGGPPPGAPGGPPSASPGWHQPGYGRPSNGMGGPPLLMYGTPVMEISENYIYVLQNGVLYQFTVKGLKLKAKTTVVDYFRGRHPGTGMGQSPQCPNCKKMCPYCRKGSRKAPAKKIPRIKR